MPWGQSAKEENRKAEKPKASVGRSLHLFRQKDSIESSN